MDVSYTARLLTIFCKPNLIFFSGCLKASDIPTEHTASTVYLFTCFSVNMKLFLMSSLRWILARVHTVASLPVIVPLDPLYPYIWRYWMLIHELMFEILMASEQV